MLGLPELQRVPKSHASGPARVPLKVDLRDLAAWFKGGPVPFGPDSPTFDGPRTLETFLAAQIAVHSGGASFTVDDLHAVARISAILIVLDGLDEVADIESRSQVVTEVDVATKRLDTICAALQVVATSRPAPFANSPGFPVDRFAYWTLESLSPDNIRTYAERWIAARRLQGQEARDVRSILGDRLSQPHIRDLARNPMQLAILLSVIHTKGVSLPDKRTALYDDYVQIFFSREAEKNAIVREHRDTLIDVHRYLGWLLHSSVEIGNYQRGITVEELRGVLTEYLTAEGRSPEIVDDLFTGIVERVVALVSRVEGLLNSKCNRFANTLLQDTFMRQLPTLRRAGSGQGRSRTFLMPWLEISTG